MWLWLVFLGVAAAAAVDAEHAWVQRVMVRSGRCADRRHTDSADFLGGQVCGSIRLALADGPFVRRNGFRLPALRRFQHRCRFRAHRARSEEHTSELQSLMRISYAVFCL